MYAKQLLHKIIGKSCSLDKRIIDILFEASATLIHCRKLSISGIARALFRPCKVKHLIKCIDRLFGNKTLHQKRYQFYQRIINWIIKKDSKPIIVVDWSGLTRCGQYHFLRAAVTVKGRTITLYEQCYHIKEYGNVKIHRDFLRILSFLLPNSCSPIIVTDAGFRNTWFKLIQSFGWDFIGRIRHNTQYKNVENKEGQPIKNLYSVATNQAKFLGRFLLAKSDALPCYFYIFKKKKLYRENRNLVGKKIRCSMSLKHAKREDEPWLLATSIDPQTASAKAIIGMYKKRMQIEESFRDIKNVRNGFGLRHCQSLGKMRLDIALLLGSLAMFVLWIIGIAAKQKNMQYCFQSNTVRDRDILSVINIGWQALERGVNFRWTIIIQAIQEIVLCATNP